MVHIKEEINIPIEAERIYKILKRIDDFPKFIKNIKQVHSRKGGANSIISDWNVVVDGAIIKWQEEDVYDDLNKTVAFKMIEGDYNKYEGRWKVEDLHGSTKLIFCVDIDWGAPALVKFVGHILKEKTSRSIRSMLLEIKKMSVGKR